MPRFVILAHDHPFLHWDFLLENGDTCRAWRLLDEPGMKTQKFAAEELPEHRLKYLDYEGPISGGRGSVTQWDTGTFEWRDHQSEICEVELAGKRWCGVFRIERIGQGWNAVYEERR